jgi:polyferredoxin
MNKRVFNNIFKFLKIFGYLLSAVFFLAAIGSFIIHPDLIGLMLSLSISGLMVFIYFFVLNKLRK